jgi:hypothetical protein
VGVLLFLFDYFILNPKRGEILAEPVREVKEPAAL